MNRKARTVRTRAVALTQPAPARVSLCAAGANQEPLHVGKSEEGLVLVQKKELPDMLTKLKAQGYDVHSIKFEGDNWNITAVEKWLTDGGYDSPEIGEDNGVFTAVEKGAAEIPEGYVASEVKTDDGVTVVLIKEKVEETVAAAAEVVPEGSASDVAPAAKDDISDAALADGGAASPDQKQKKGKKKPTASEEQGQTASDEASKSEGDGGSEIVEPATGGVLEVMKTAKALPEERRKGLYQVTQLGDMINDLRWFTSDFAYNAEYVALFGGDEDDAAMNTQVLDAMRQAALGMIGAFEVLCADAVEDMKEAFTPAMKTEGEQAPGGADPVIETPAAKEGETEVQPVATEEPAEKTGEQAPGGATPEATPEAPPAWATALFGNITKSVEELSGKVNAVASKQAAMEEQASTEAAKAASTAQSRKSVDPERDAPSNPKPAEKTEATKSISDLRFKAALGF